MCLLSLSKAFEAGFCKNACYVIDSAGVDSHIAQSAVLGVVQGLTEFLPISSSAHLILVPKFLGWEDQGLAFDVALHLGTLVGVMAYFWRDLKNILLQKEQHYLIGYLIVATIPAAVAGLLLEHKVETLFRSPALIAGTLMVMGGGLAMADRLNKGEKMLSDLTLKMALIVGLTQALALVPGVSRSGITITTALALGLQRREAARFSFLLSMPIIAGAGLLKAHTIFASPNPAAIGTGFIAAGVSGFIAIWALMRYVQRRRYTPFVIYRWVLGALILLNLSHFS